MEAGSFSQSNSHPLILGTLDIHSEADYSQPDDVADGDVGDHPSITSVHDLDKLYEVFEERDGVHVLTHCSFIYRDREGMAFFGRSTRSKLDLSPADFLQSTHEDPRW